MSHVPTHIRWQLFEIWNLKMVNHPCNVLLRFYCCWNTPPLIFALLLCKCGFKALWVGPSVAVRAITQWALTRNHFCWRLAEKSKKTANFLPYMWGFLVWCVCASESSSEVLKSLFVRDKSALDTTHRAKPMADLGEGEINELKRSEGLFGIMHTHNHFIHSGRDWTAERFL